MVYSSDAPHAQGPVCVYKSGATVYRQGDRAGPVHFVRMGCILLSRVTRSGTRQVGGFVLTNEAFGWETDPEHRLTAEACGPTSVETFGTISTLAAAEWRRSQLVPALVNIRNQITIISRSTADGRVAAFLDDIMRRQHCSDRVYLPMHRADISDYLGLSPETVSRVLRRFQDSDLIKLESIRMMTVSDPERLSGLYNN